MKTCTDCKERLSPNLFQKNGTLLDGAVRLRANCKDCHNTSIRLRALTDPNFYRNKSFKRNYGITVADYEEMFAAQQGLCAICNLLLVGELLVVDHDHTTGEVRALLCHSCNKAIGFAKENPLTLRAMAQYIEVFNV